MKLKSIMLAFLITCTLTCSACGSSNGSSNSSSKKDTSTKTDAVTKIDSSISKADGSLDLSGIDSEAASSEDEKVIVFTEDELSEPEAIELADKALKAYAELDFKGIYEYTDLKYLFSENGEDVPFEDFKTAFGEIVGDNNVKDAEYDYELLSAEADYEMLAYLVGCMSETTDESFTLDGCYRVKGNTPSGESNLYLLHISGKWYADMVFTFDNLTESTAPTE